MPTRRKPATAKPAITEPPLAIPPLTPEELAAERRITLGLQELADRLHRRNLHHAVLLAQQAQCGRGPLVEHFAEIGRRFSHLLDAPQKPKLRLVKTAATD